MITIVAKKTIKEDKKEEFKNLANKLIEESRKETGCIEYDLYEDLRNSNKVAFIEVWESEEAISYITIQYILLILYQNLLNFKRKKQR